MRTLRNECVDHVLIPNERHLRLALEDYAGCYNAVRPHRSPDLEPPLPAARPRAPTGPISARPALGGPRHTYVCAA